ncbi:MAG: hypothetical protein Q8Q20_04095 [bacterium]|nr:hypothetical protein [bacterium]
MRSLVFALSLFAVCAWVNEVSAGIYIETRNWNVKQVVVHSGGMLYSDPLEDRETSERDYGLAVMEVPDGTFIDEISVVWETSTDDPDGTPRYLTANFQIGQRLREERFRIVVSDERGKLVMYLESGGFAPGTVWTYPDDHDEASLHQYVESHFGGGSAFVTHSR